MGMAVECSAPERAVVECILRPVIGIVVDIEAVFDEDARVHRRHEQRRDESHCVDGGQRVREKHARGPVVQIHREERARSPGLRLLLIVSTGADRDAHIHAADKRHSRENVKEAPVLLRIRLIE